MTDLFNADNNVALMRDSIVARREGDFLTAGQVREIFAPHKVDFVHPSYDLSNGEHVTFEKEVDLIRLSDGHRFGKRNADGPQRQYDYLVDLAANVTGESPGDLKIRGAGTTRNGARAFVQISTANVLSVAGMDYSPLLAFAMSHDGSLSIQSSDAVIAIICANTFAACLGAVSNGNANGAKTKQTKNATDELIVSKHAAALRIERTVDEFDAAIKKLTEVTVTDKQWAAILDELAPVNNDKLTKNKLTRNEEKRGELNALYTSDDRASTWNGTELGVLQALNTYDLWERSTRKDITAESRMNDEALDGKRAQTEIQTFKMVERILATV
jgi:phage/plasmid-like protein (TIGR03299 family)